MSIESADRSSTHAAPTRLIRTVLSSVSLVIGMLGILLILTGYVMQTGVWAALLPLWGIGLMLVGFGSYALVTWSRR